MRLRGLAAFVVLGVSLASASGAFGGSAPEFAEYPAFISWNGDTVRPLLRDEFANSYKTRLRQIAEGPANFAGNIAVGSWGCGSGGCLYGGLVNLHTGEVTPFPQTTIQTDGSEYVEGAGVRYRADSNLMVFRGVANESGPPSANYYVFEGGGFRLLHSEPLELPQAVQYEPSRTFMGYECTQDCSGHEAGYEWAEEKGITDPDDCSGNSNSFVEGCIAYAEENE